MIRMFLAARGAMHIGLGQMRSEFVGVGRDPDIYAIAGIQIPAENCAEVDHDLCSCFMTKSACKMAGILIYGASQALQGAREHKSQ